MTAPIFDANLPLPPTLNQYYRARVVSGKPIVYKNDKGYFGGIARFAPKAPTTARLKIAITVHFATRQAQDLDNRLKCLLDALTGRIWCDDSQIDEILIKRGKIIKGGLVHLQVWAIQ